jgi:hypothetical protein
LANSRVWAAMVRPCPGGPFTTFLALSPVPVSRHGICTDISHGKWCKGRLNGERARPAASDMAASDMATADMTAADMAAAAVDLRPMRITRR